MQNIKAYRVSSIVKEDWSFPEITSISYKFPGDPIGVFNAQRPRPLDILVGSDALCLLPTYKKDIGCKNWKAGLCCNKSMFGHGLVTVGQCDRILTPKNSYPSIFSVCQ